MRLLHTGWIWEGKMRLDNKQMLLDHVKELEGKRFGFELGEEENTRTARQNKFLWGVCYPLVVRALLERGEAGVNKDVVHKLLTEMFLEPQIVYVKTLNKVVTEYSSKRLTKRQFSDYWKLIQQWAAEQLQIYIPDPNEDLLTETNETLQ